MPGSHRGGDRDGGARYTTIRTYRVPDRDEPDNASVVKEKDVVIRRDGPGSVVSRRHKDDQLEYRVVTREREVEAPLAPRRDELRVIERGDRDLVVRAPSPPDQRFHREYRVVEREGPPLRDSYDLERYVRTVNYYPPPQPIVIRQEPQQIIIRERERDRPRYELVERDREEVRDDRQRDREEVRDDRQLVRRGEERRRDDDDYYYERTTREVDRGPRRDGGGEAFEDRGRRDIDPRDSASQTYYSSDDEDYVRRVRRVSRSRSDSPAHRRHLAEGAIAGIGAAELVRHHRKKQGEDPGHRGRNLIGSAALGAVGAEVLSRARSKVRSRRSSRSSRSSSRSASSDRETYRRSKSKRRDRSRSQSTSRLKQLGGVAAVAAVGALAGYALRNKNKQQQIIERRSRSRVRAGSVMTEEQSVIEQGPATSGFLPGRKSSKARIAQAGLATAAAAGLWQRMRSRSRGAKGRSESKFRAGVPVAAAGLGGAALAGLYERNKARKAAARDDADDDRNDRDDRDDRGYSRSNSRSRSRSRSAPYTDEPGLRRRSSDPALIEYGGEPIYSEQPGVYRRRHRGNASDSSPDGRSRSRSRSRTRGLAETAGAAAVAGVAAHELTKRSERKRAEKERRRREREEDEYAHEQQYSPPPMGANAAHFGNGDYYPQTNSFPPPPANADPGYPLDDEYPPYNPADYPPPPGAGDEDHRYVPNETYAGDGRYDERDEYGVDEKRGEAEHNVSFEHPGGGEQRREKDGDGEPLGLKHRRARRARFAPADSRRAPRGGGDGNDSPTSAPEENPARRPPLGRRERGVETPGRGADVGGDADADAQSESTVEMPARFDARGRRIGGDEGGGEVARAGRGVRSWTLRV